MRPRTFILHALALSVCISLGAQEPAPAGPMPPPATILQRAAPTAQPDQPLPDIPALMHDVELNQRNSEAIEKNYLYHSAETQQEVDGQGNVKKTTLTEYDHYWIEGVPVRKLVRKDGKDLPPGELAKENARIDKQAAEARARRAKADAAGKETDARGDDEVTVSRLLELGAFTNPRRVLLGGRPTIAVDYTGDPHARTHGRAEDAIREMAGTAWVDEQDHVLARVEGRFVNPFKIAGGLVVDIHRDTHFTFDQTRINDEVWLPARIDAEGTARALLFFSFNGSFHIVDSDYRKFRVASTILPGFTLPPPAPPKD